MAKTLFDKIWDAHTIQSLPDGGRLIGLDRVFLHERTGSIALLSMAEAGRQVWRPEHVFATLDHIVDTRPGRGDETTMEGGSEFIREMRRLSIEAGITLFDLNDPRQGISHVVAAEQGIALPGLTLVCPDSHTCTLGALGMAAWGIGSSDCEHVLATGTLQVPPLKQMRVTFDGEIGPGVTAKDMILHLIGEHSASGGAGHVLEFAGSAVRALDLSSRFTLCNMAVEFSAFTGLIAVDQQVIDYAASRPLAPRDELASSAQRAWRDLHSDADARFDAEIHIDAAAIEPSVTWGTTPQHVTGVGGRVPEVSEFADPATRQAAERALAYMGLDGGERLSELAINGAFIGSCTNARIEDLRQAAAQLRGRRVADGVLALCVPGSSQVRRQAEAEGLHEVFLAAGFQWRESGCSLCFYAGGEGFEPGSRVVSSTNRNFEGRQGRGVRTHLASPATVAASAVAGRITDPRACADAHRPSRAATRP